MTTPPTVAARLRLMLLSAFAYLAIVDDTENKGVRGNSAMRWTHRMQLDSSKLLKEPPYAPLIGIASTAGVILLQSYSAALSATTFEGPLYSSGRCTPNMVMFRVDVNGNTATGEWGYDDGPSAKFSGPTNASGFTAERINRSGNLQRIFATKSNTGYDVIINGSRCNPVGRTKPVG